MPSKRFEELTEEFLAYYRIYSDDLRTMPSNIRILGRHLGSMLVTQIGPREIEDMIAARIKQGVSRATVNRQRGALSRLFGWAMDRGYHPGPNPVRKIRKFRESAGRERFLSPDEEARLILAAPTHLKPILITALCTGGRMGEILALRRRDVDLERRIVVFRKETTKSRKRRVVPMTRRLAATIRDLGPGRPDDALFYYQGHPLRSIRTGFLTARRKAGLGKDVVFHTLRHTFASRAAMRGIGLRLLQKYLGHSSIALTERYSHLSPEFVEEGVRFLEPMDPESATEDWQD